MNFTIKGISFSKDDLSEIKLDELKVGSISTGHIVYLLPSGKSAIFLLRAGDYIENEFIEKYKAKGKSSFHILPIAKIQDILEYKEILQLLSKLQVGSQTRLLTQKLMNKLVLDSLHEEKAYLSFVIACYEHFYKFDLKVIELYQAMSVELYTRALISSSLSVMTSLINGFYGYEFIQDLYNASFVIDYGLLHENKYSYAVAQACEAERNLPGSGMGLLKSDIDLDSFKNHPIASYEFAQANAYAFNHIESIEYLRYHHEKYDGTGFPDAYTYASLGEADILLALSDNLVPFKEHIFAKGDGKVILIDSIADLIANSNSDLLPIRRLLKNWNGFFKWAKTTGPEDLVLGEVANGQ